MLTNTHIYNRSWDYWFRQYGKIGNRPLPEIKRLAKKEMLLPAFSRKYEDNTPNNRLGYTHAYKAGLLASITATTMAEVHFAQTLELTLSKLVRKLEALYVS